MRCLSAEGLLGASVDGNVGASDGGEDAQCIPCRAGEGRVTVDGGDTEEVEMGVVSGEEDGEGVLPEVLE